MLSVAVVAIVDDVFFGFLLALLVESVGGKTFQFSGTGAAVPREPPLAPWPTAFETCVP